VDQTLTSNGGVQYLALAHNNQIWLLPQTECGTSKTMAEIKTQPTENSVLDFLERVDNEKRRADAFTLLELFERVTQRKAVMWGDSIIGFGSYEYTNTKGTYTWMMTGFSPRKQNLTIYVMQGFANYSEDLMLLGKVKTAKSCLYISSLAKIDLNQLERFITKVVADMEQKYDCS
jgi:hypothetical protein